MTADHPQLCYLYLSTGQDPPILPQLPPSPPRVPEPVFPPPHHDRYQKGTMSDKGQNIGKIRGLNRWKVEKEGPLKKRVGLRKKAHCVPLLFTATCVSFLFCNCTSPKTPCNIDALPQHAAQGKRVACPHLSCLA